MGVLERGLGLGCCCCGRVRVSVSVAVVGFKLLKVALRRSGLGPFVEVTEDYQWPGEAGAWLRVSGRVEGGVGDTGGLGYCCCGRLDL